MKIAYIRKRFFSVPSLIDIFKVSLFYDNTILKIGYENG